jgi:hypothetical protein
MFDISSEVSEKLTCAITFFDIPQAGTNFVQVDIMSFLQNGVKSLIKCLRNNCISPTDFKMEKKQKLKYTVHTLYEMTEVPKPISKHKLSFINYVCDN